MPNPAHRAEEESLETFLADYSAADATFALSTGHTALLGAMSNPDVAARAGIAARLLDDGADASVTLESGVNALHVLFSTHHHDLALEVPLVARLVAGGADVNRVSRRKGPPLLLMIDSGMATIEGIAAVVDAIEESATIDLDVPVNAKGSPRKTLREEIATSEWPIAELRSRLGIEHLA